MWLVLASRHDTAALWAASRLRARLGSITVLSPELLFRAARWEHRLGRGESAEPTTTLSLADGSTLRSERIRGVLNRIPSLPEDLFAGGSQADRVYARQEATALVMSWLVGLPCPVLNRPCSRGLAGWWGQPLEWAAMAARAGLVVARSEEVRAEGRCDRNAVRAEDEGLGRAGATGGQPWRSSIHDAAGGAHAVGLLLVVGERTHWCGPGAAPPCADACRRLARGVGCGILGIHLAERGDHHFFAGASAMPDLRLGGEGLAEDLAMALGASPVEPVGHSPAAAAASTMGAWA